ncbi:hypothetical protein V8E36_009123 [Tilletia maclaganii]
MATTMAPPDLHLPASATASLQGLSDLIEIYAHHRLPKAYLSVIWLYLAGHSLMFLLCLPYFLRQIKSGRFWVVRLVNTERGRIIMPNHLDASATLIGAYTLWDVGFCIKLMLGYYSRSSQKHLPIIVCLRFIILATIGWIFLLGFFLVKVPPNRHKTPSWLWNIGIFALPCSVYLSTIYCLYEADVWWNDYWTTYKALRPALNAALAAGATVPTQEQINTTILMLGVQLHQSNRWKLIWALPLAVFASAFATAVLVVTLSILLSHYSGLKKKAELPMQTLAFSAMNGRRPEASMTASMGIRKWMRELPSVPEERHQAYSVLSDATEKSASPATDDTKSAAGAGAGAVLSQSSQQQRATPSRSSKRSSGVTFSRMAMYGLGLRPLAQDAYNDPTGGFSESDTQAGLRSLLLHTAVQGVCIFVTALVQVGLCVIIALPAFQQPLIASSSGKRNPGGWGAEWIYLHSILRLLEFDPTAIPGVVLFVSILIRQAFAIGISQAREAAASGAIRPTHTNQRSGANFHLPAPGPSIWARFTSGQISVSEMQSEGTPSRVGSGGGSRRSGATREVDVESGSVGGKSSSQLGTEYDDFLATGSLKSARHGGADVVEGGIGDDDRNPISDSTSRYEERQVGPYSPSRSDGRRTTQTRSNSQRRSIITMSDSSRGPVARSFASDTKTANAWSSRSVVTPPPSSQSPPRPVWKEILDDDSVGNLSNVQSDPAIQLGRQ